MDYDYFYIDSSNNRQGPCKREALKDNGVKAESLIWREGLDSWTKAFETPELKELFEEEYYLKFMPGSDDDQENQETQIAEIPETSQTSDDKTDDGQIKIQNVQEVASHKHTDKEKREHMPGCLLAWLWFVFIIQLIFVITYGWQSMLLEPDSELQEVSLTAAVTSVIIAYATFQLLRWKRRGLYIYLVVAALSLIGGFISGETSAATGIVIHAGFLFYLFRGKPINDYKFSEKKYLWDYMD